MKVKPKKLSAAELAKFEAEQKAAREFAEAESFGRAVRREHEALGRLLIMLDHITGMPTVPAVVFEARQAFADVRARTVKISSPAEARWVKA
jgi:hypothetical protein